MAVSTTSLCFASPVVGDDTPHAWIRPSPDGRYRSSRGSSDDRDEPRLDGWFSEDFRVGGPALAPSPAVTTHLPPGSPYSSQADGVSTFSKSVLEILKESHICFKAFSLCYRRCKYFPDDEPIPTLFVDAKKRSPDDQWLPVCRKLYDLLRANGLSNFSVEISDKRAHSIKYPSPVPCSDPIFLLWDNILEQILGEIIQSHILAVECFRFGESENQHENPTTIILTVDHCSVSSSWKNTRETIVSILTRHELHHVGVLIAEGRVFRGKSSLDRQLPETTWQDALQLGLSLGVYQSKQSSTFGGWLEIQQQEGAEWTKLGLTCFHSVLPDLQSLSENDRAAVLNSFSNGISINDPVRDILKVEQPSLKDASINSEELSKARERLFGGSYKAVKDVIEDGGDASPRSRERYERTRSKITEISASLSRIEEFHDSRRPCDDLLSSSLPINPQAINQFSRSYAGHIYAASGYRQIRPNSDTMRQVDWALVNVPKARHSDNSISMYEKFSPYFDYLCPYPGIPANEAELYKLGRSTDITRGSFSQLKSAHLWVPDSKGDGSEIVTYEYAVTGALQSIFSDPGDSGALVFDFEANCIGMIFGGNSTSRVSYITLLPDLFSDIKAVTGAVDVRLAV